MSTQGSPVIQDERFRPVKRLGKGRSSRVYRALDSLTNEHVAVRIFARRDASDAPHLLLALEQLVTLHHPQLVPVRFASIIDGHPYVVADLHPGRTLASELREVGPMSPDEARAVAIDVLRALEGAHASGLTHGELSPDKVWLDGEGRAVVDEVGQWGVHPPDRPRVGVVPYLAPELRTGPRSASVAGDIYAVGALLHTMLTGRAVADLTAEALDPDLPKDLRVVLRKCTATAPGQRYASVSRVLEVLDPEATGEVAVSPLSPPEPSINTPLAPARHDVEPLEEAPPASTQNPLPLVVGLVVIGLIAAGAWWLWTR